MLMDTAIAHAEGDMEISNYIALAAPLLFFVIALISKRRSIFRWMITLLFFYVCVLCTFAFDSVARDVALQAQESGNFSPEFLMGLTSLNDRLLFVRAIILLSAGLLWVLTMLTTRRWKD